MIKRSELQIIQRRHEAELKIETKTCKRCWYSQS